MESTWYLPLRFVKSENKKAPKGVKKSPLGASHWNLLEIPFHDKLQKVKDGLKSRIYDLII
jgi:hypothetical protein